MVLNYRPIIRAQTGGSDERGRFKNSNKERERESKMIKKKKQSPIYVLFLIILSDVAGVPGLQPCIAFLACSSSPKDNTVMMPDGNKTDHQRMPRAWLCATVACFSLLPRLPFVLQHKFAPSSLSCWLCLFRGCQWRGISCTDSQQGVGPVEAACLSYHTGCLERVETKHTLPAMIRHHLPLNSRRRKEHIPDHCVSLILLNSIRLTSRGLISSSLMSRGAVF